MRNEVRYFYLIHTNSLIWKYVNKQNNVKHEFVNVHHGELDLTRPSFIKIYIEVIFSTHTDVCKSLIWVPKFSTPKIDKTMSKLFYNNACQV